MKTAKKARRTSQEGQKAVKIREKFPRRQPRRPVRSRQEGWQERRPRKAKTLSTRVFREAFGMEPEAFAFGASAVGLHERRLTRTPAAQGDHAADRDLRSSLGEQARPSRRSPTGTGIEEHRPRGCRSTPDRARTTARSIQLTTTTTSQASASATSVQCTTYATNSATRGEEDGNGESGSDPATASDVAAVASLVSGCPG